ncbi:hypothetical protein BJ912DRAFT_920070 [Pholiota molesta]|nr:hypothetical protein BJ912DRAFT_920070 [Pholiota molesta]
MSAYSQTYGALLLGSLCASGFSGIAAIQALLYFKLFPKDRKALRELVVVVWLLDVVHTALVWAAMWEYMVTNAVNQHLYQDYIPGSASSLPIFIQNFKAVLTFLTHCFFAHRIYHLSRGNWWLTVPVLCAMLTRFVSVSFKSLSWPSEDLCTHSASNAACASVSGGEMIKLKSYHLFREQFRQTKAESLTLVRGQSWPYNRRMHSVYLRDRLANNWIVLDDSLVFLGLHFVIGKLYANSLLATLNTRQQLRRSRATVTAVDLMHTPHLSSLPMEFQSSRQSKERNDIAGVQVDVVKSVQYDIEMSN